MSQCKLNTQQSMEKARGRPLDACSGFRWVCTDFSKSWLNFQSLANRLKTQNIDKQIGFANELALRDQGGSNFNQGDDVFPSMQIHVGATKNIEKARGEVFFSTHWTPARAFGGHADISKSQFEFSSSGAHYKWEQIKNEKHGPGQTNQCKKVANESALWGQSVIVTMLLVSCLLKVSLNILWLSWYFIFFPSVDPSGILPQNPSVESFCKWLFCIESPSMESFCKNIILWRKSV